MTVKELVESFTTDGKVNLDGIEEFKKELMEQIKVLKAENKDALKAERDAEREEIAKVGKAYYDGLKIGDHFTYTMSDGTIVEAIKIQTKSNTGATASCELVEVPEGAKSNKRYPKFWQVNVPAQNEEVA